MDIFGLKITNSAWVPVSLRPPELRSWGWKKPSWHAYFSLLLYKILLSTSIMIQYVWTLIWNSGVVAGPFGLPEIDKLHDDGCPALVGVRGAAAFKCQVPSLLWEWGCQRWSEFQGGTFSTLLVDTPTGQREKKEGDPRSPHSPPAYWLRECPL